MAATQAQIQALQAQQNAAAQEDLYTWLQKRAQLQVVPAAVRLPRNTNLPAADAAAMQASLYEQLDRLMFGCGGAIKNDPAAVELLQRMVTQYLDSLLHAAMNEAAASVSRPSQHEQVQRALTRHAAEGFGVHSVLAVLRQHNLSHAAHVEHVMGQRARLSGIIHAKLSAGSSAGAAGGAGEDAGEQGREGAAAAASIDGLYTVSAEEQCYTSSRVYVHRPTVRNVLEARQAEQAWAGLELFDRRVAKGEFAQLQGAELEQAKQAAANQAHAQQAMAGMRAGAAGGANAAITAALVAQQRAALQARSAAAAAAAAGRMPAINQAITALQQPIAQADALRAIDSSPELKLLFAGHPLFLKVAEELIVIERLRAAIAACSHSNNAQHLTIAQALRARMTVCETQLATVTQQRRAALGQQGAQQQAQLVAQVVQAQLQAKQAAAAKEAAQGPGGGVPSVPLSAAGGGPGQGVLDAAAAVAALAASGTLPIPGNGSIEG